MQKEALKFHVYQLVIFLASQFFIILRARSNTIFYQSLLSKKVISSEKKLLIYCLFMVLFTFAGLLRAPTLWPSVVYNVCHAILYGWSAAFTHAMQNLLHSD